jgi:hypothetical protein
VKKVQKLTNLEQLLDRIDDAARDRKRVSLGAVLELVGRRSFGPLLLVAGVVALAPVIGDIPGVPTIIGTLVFLITIQLLFGREYFWLPGWVLKRSVSSDKLRKALKWLRSPARFVDRLLRPRLTFFTKGAVIYVIAMLCIIIAVSMPAMELVPFLANLAGAAFTAFGLSLIAHDGLLALIAFGFTAISVGLVAHTIF